MRNWIVVALFTIGILSCKSVEISNQKNKVANASVELGTLGETFFDYSQNIFETKAFPQLNGKIRISKEIIQFNTSTYKAYLNANRSQGGYDLIEYVDSLDVKPQYVNLKIVDKVSYLRELNASYNSFNLDLIKVVPGTKLVTSVSVVLNQEKFELLKDADEIYLENGQNRKYKLNLYKKNKPVGELNVDAGVVFSYTLASFCWGENERYKPVVKNYVRAGSGCKNNTFKDFDKVLKRSKRLTFDDF